MALGFAQPLTEMSANKFSGAKARPAGKSDILGVIFEPIV
jgi:hypothetical protein